MNPFVDFIQRFTSLNSDEADRLASSMSVRKYRADEILLTEKSICRSILFVVSGTARSYFINQEGQEYTWNFHFNDLDSTFENYFILDYNSFLQQTPTPLTFQVISDLEVIELRHENVVSLLNQSPKVQEVVRIMTENAYSSIHHRAFSFLTKTAKERYLQLLNDEPYLLHKFQHYHIASYLGIAPQSLSRLRKEIFAA